MLLFLHSFNTLCTGGERTVKQLKTQWGAMKIEAKKEVSSHRKQIFKTGGGPQPKELSASVADLLSWLPKEFEVDTNPFDSDYVVGNIIYK